MESCLTNPIIPSGSQVVLMTKCTICKYGYHISHQITHSIGWLWIGSLQTDPSYPTRGALHSKAKNNSSPFQHQTMPTHASQEFCVRALIIGSDETIHRNKYTRSRAIRPGTFQTSVSTCPEWIAYSRHCRE